METDRELDLRPEFITLVSDKRIKPVVAEALESKIAEPNEKIAHLSEKFRAVTEKKTKNCGTTNLTAGSSFRRNCLTITGVPEREREDTDQLVLDVAKSAGVLLSPDDIDVFHRLGRRSPQA